MQTKSRLDPAIALAWTINVSLAATAAASLRGAAALFVVVIVCGLAVSRGSLGGVLKYWRILIFVPGLLFLFHAFFTPGPRLLGIGPVSLSKEGVVAGTSYMIRLATSVAAALFVIAAIDLSSVAPSLMRAGIPRNGAFSIYLMLRFVPLMTAEAETARLALLTRMPSPSLRGRMLRFRRYLLNLMVVSIRRAEQTALAMDARGFRSEKARTTIHDAPVLTPPTLFVLASTVVSWIIVVFIR